MKPIVSRLSDLDGLEIGCGIIFKPLREKHGVHRTYEARGIPNTECARANGYAEAAVVSSAPPHNCDEEEASRLRFGALAINLLVDREHGLDSIESTAIATCRVSEERVYIESFIERTLIAQEAKA